MLHFLKGREFYRSMFKIAVPVAVQNLMATALNFVDTIMIGRLGATELAAVGMANQVFFLMALFLFGVYSGSGIFISQFWGKKDVVNIRRVLGLALVVGLAASTLFALGALLFPVSILAIFMKGGPAVSLGRDYLLIVAYSYPITAVSFAYGFLSRGVGQARLPMFTGVISLGTNTLLNYLLIFGNFGFPALGVRGAALATLLARGLEMLLLLSVIYGTNMILAAKFRELLDISLAFARNLFATSITVILNEFTWALGIMVYSATYARMGEHAFAAVQMAMPIQNISMVLFFGFANACAVMLGNQLGADREEIAVLYARKFAFLAPALSLFFSVFIFLNARWLVSGYAVSDGLKEAAAGILTVFSLVLAFKMFNLINIVGILRSGGDTRYALLLDSGSVWLVGVPMALLGGLVLQLPVHLVTAMISLEELFKALFGLHRFRSGKWVRNLVNHITETS